MTNEPERFSRIGSSTYNEEYSANGGRSVVSAASVNFAAGGGFHVTCVRRAWRVATTHAVETVEIHTRDGESARDQRATDGFGWQPGHDHVHRIGSPSG